MEVPFTPDPFSGFLLHRCAEVAVALGEEVALIPLALCLLPELADHSFPFICHKLMTAIGRMDIVPNPVVGWGAFRRFVENGLELHQGRVVFLGQPGHDFSPLADVLVDFACRLHERLRKARA